jgi:uncharacterized cupin superfamily protein
MTTHAQLFEQLAVTDVELGPSPAPARVIAGDPQCGEYVLVDLPGLEIGVWEVTEGRFASSKTDVGEVMHFVAGAGELLHSDGSTTVIEPGVTVSLRAGWTGEWHVMKPVRKVYVIYRDVADAEA